MKERYIPMENRRGNLCRYILPTVASSCCNFLYVVVDGIFVGQGVGVDALGAVNIAMPFTLITTALAMLMGIGGVTVTAIRLGRGDEKGANDAFLHASAISVAIGVLLMLAGMIFSRPVAAISGANGTFLELTATYIFYYSAFSLPFVCSILLQGFVRNDGSPGLVSVAVITGAVTNIFLDWLFVFPLKLGIAGAAVASGLGQVSSLLILLLHFVRRKGVLRLRPFHLSPFLFWKIFKRGLPEMISQFGTPVTTVWMNHVLIRQLGDLAVSAFSVLAYLTSFSMGFFFGVSEGLQPLIGQSYGKKDPTALRWYFRAGLLINLAGSVLVFVLFLLWGGPICSLFNSDPRLVKTATDALPKFGWAFIVISQNLIISAYLYSTKRTLQAIIAAICRCLILNTLTILLLPLLFGGGLIWQTVGIAETLSLLVYWVLLKTSERKGIVFR